MGKKNQTVTISSDLYKDLKKLGKNFCVGMATEVRDNLTKSAAVAIEMFYQDYDPDFYHRHYYNFRRKSFRKYYDNKHGHIVRGGVELSPDAMDDIYQDPVEQVFDMVYHGFHGVASGFINKVVPGFKAPGFKEGDVIKPKSFYKIPEVMDPSPLEIIYNSRNNILKQINNGQYNKYGYERIGANTYETIDIGG